MPYLRDNVLTAAVSCAQLVVQLPELGIVELLNLGEGYVDLVVVTTSNLATVLVI